MGRAHRPQMAACVISRDESPDWQHTDVKLAINYDLQENITLYGSYTTGFKSGSWSSDALDPFASFTPAELGIPDATPADIAIAIIQAARSGAAFRQVADEEVSTYEIGLRSDLWLTGASAGQRHPF